MTARKRQKCGQSGLHHAELLERELTLRLAQPPARLDEIEARAGPRLKRNARQSLCFTSQIARRSETLRLSSATSTLRRAWRICTGALRRAASKPLQRLIGLCAGVSKGAVARATFEERDGKHARDCPRLMGLANGRDGGRRVEGAEQVHRRGRTELHVVDVAVGNLVRLASGSDVGSILTERRRRRSWPWRAGLHSIQVDVWPVHPTVGRAECESERLARLAQRLVSR